MPDNRSCRARAGTPGDDGVGLDSGRSLSSTRYKPDFLLLHTSPCAPSRGGHEVNNNYVINVINAPNAPNVPNVPNVLNVLTDKTDKIDPSLKGADKLTDCGNPFLFHYPHRLGSDHRDIRLPL
jgi:hypothetical protein